MNLTIKKNSWYKLLLFATCISFTLFTSCKKVEEPLRPVGQELPYINSKKNLVALFDSIPDASVFKMAFNRSTLQEYMDSLSAGGTDVPYTLFIPTDQAFIKAGYTKEKINSMQVSELNLLLGYLTLPGSLPVKMLSSSAEITFYPLIHPDPYLERTEPSVFSDSRPYYYALSVGFLGNSLLLNGKKVKGNTTGILAKNGALFMIDSLIKRPEKEIYQVITADTSLSFYMAALRKSNEIYTQKGILGTEGSNTQYNDTTWMMLRTSNVSPFGPGSLPFAVVFAPDNNAFRKAGFSSIGDIESFINRSALATGPDYTEMLTNMDSILVNHRFLSNFSRVNTGRNYLYTPDLTNTFTLNNDINLGAISLGNNNGRITIHRQDYPEGRGANIVPGSDVNTLNGVVHKVDNLMLTRP